VSDGCIHQHVQALGQVAAELELPTPALPPGEPEFSLVIMLDGWMARERGPDWGVGPRKKNPARIVWHEIKSAVIYRLEQRGQNASGRGLLIEKFVVATPRKLRRWISELRCRPRRSDADWGEPRRSIW
jgi:hypothetical protein